MIKLKYREVREYRHAQLFRQLNRCQLCREEIEDDAVLDHDHKTGRIRAVLHRGCNAMLGKIENNMARNNMDEARLQQWALNIVEYIKKTHTEYLHPTYKTLEERKMQAYKKKKKTPGRGGKKY